jgi:alkanesulfonate monooxygenase SsuD/methylene tetrahydromethanopterin reductase-like flavin-dependent oxidoreductase (luciferase family)
VPDRGQPLRFGLFPTPNAEDLDRLFSRVKLADELGLELVGIQDHPYQRRFLDTWSLIPALAARTERIAFFPDVANLPLRGPAMIAKAAASIDVLSAGRFELGIGAGSFWEAVEAMGGPRRSPGESVEALEEAIEIIRRFWSGERSVSFQGSHYRVKGVKPGPSPAHPTGIWIGAYGPRMLRLTGRIGDGWVPSLSRVSDLGEKVAVLDEAAESHGRDPSEIRRLLNVSGTIGAEPGEEGHVEGPVEAWVERLSGLALEHGFDSFILWPAQEEEGQLRAFAEQVAPAVRDAVAAARR